MYELVGQLSLWQCAMVSWPFAWLEYEIPVFLQILMSAPGAEGKDWSVTKAHHFR